MPPRAIKTVTPTYPQDAIAKHIAGGVVVRVSLNELGKATSVEIERGVEGLNEVALAAVRQWEFTPGYANNAPTPTVVKATFVFVLDGSKLPIPQKTR
jgi:TonB family protein